LEGAPPLKITSAPACIPAGVPRSSDLSFMDTTDPSPFLLRKWVLRDHRRPEPSAAGEFERVDVDAAERGVGRTALGRMRSDEIPISYNLSHIMSSTIDLLSIALMHTLA
jgi:hypothetical protein